MCNWDKQITTGLLTVLLFTFLITPLPIEAANIHPQYAGIKEISAPHSIVFQVANNSTVYTDSPTPQPTPNTQPGILWTTNISWDLANSPAKDLSSSEISSKSRSWTTPIIVDGVLFAGATSEVHEVGNGRFPGSSRFWINIYAFNLTNGKEIWSYQANYQSITGLTVSEGKVFFGVRGEDNFNGDTVSSLYALNAANGRLLWKTVCPYIYATPAVGDGKIFVDSARSLLAFDEADGRLLWNVTATDFFFVNPVTTDGKVFVSSSTLDHTFYALNTADGSRIWSVSGEMSSAAVGNGAVFVPSNDGNVYALNIQTGAELWRYSTTEFNWVNYTGHSKPVYFNGILYLTSDSGQHIHIQGHDSADTCIMQNRYSIIALDANTGHKLWNYTAPDYRYETPVAVGGSGVYAISWQSIIGLNIHNGALNWNYTQPDILPQTEPAAVNSTLYLGFSDGQIYAITPPEMAANAPVMGDFWFDLAVLVVLVFVIALTLFALLFWYRKTG